MLMPTEVFHGGIVVSLACTAELYGTFFEAYMVRGDTNQGVEATAIKKKKKKTLPKGVAVFKKMQKVVDFFY